MSGDLTQKSAPGADVTRDQRARDEAATWYARLNDERVANDELAAFFDWRSDSLNDAAYSRIEALATGVRAMADDPRLQALAEAAMKRRRPRGLPHFRLGIWPLLGAVAVAAVVVAVLITWPFGQQTYRTAVGERRAISLADGSRIELNTDSQVRVRLSATQRKLTLDHGQALFAVAHDAARPFIVTAGDTSVRALGTRFDVYLAPDGVRIVLAEGRVEVREAKVATAVTLYAGQQVEVSPARAARPAAVDVAAATGWTDGRLTFQNVRLSDAVAEINRYSRQQVVLGPGVPADRLVNGVFDAGDTGAFVAAVSSLLDLKGAPRTDGNLELTPDHPGPA
jgi:transmembrane sensor